MQRETLTFCTELARTGEDLVPLRMLHVRGHLVNHPDLVKEVLVTKAKQFRKIEQVLKVLRQVDGNGLALTEGEFWLRQRRLMQPLFHARRFAGYADAMVACTREMGDGWHDGQELDLAAEMTYLTLRIVGRTMFGVEIAQRAARLGEAVHVLSEAFTKEAAAPFIWPLWFPGQGRKRWAIRYLDEFLRGVIAERRRTGEDKGDLLSMLLLAVDEEGDGKGMTDEQARDEAVTMFNAGHDSTAAGLAWVWHALGRNKTELDRVVTEIDTVLGDRPATSADLPKLKRCEWAVRETLRLYPPVWIIFTRKALAGVDLGRHRVRKGDWMYILPYTLHRDARWFPNPEVFDPERFAPGRVEAISQYAYIPFGAGPHMCIGNAFATMEMVLILATVLQRYRPALLETREAEPEALLSLRPRGGVRAVLHRRSAPVPAGAAV